MMILWTAKLLGLAITAYGLAIVAKPEIAQKIFAFFSEGRRIYIAAAIRITTGGVMLAAASQSRLPFAAVVLGLLFVVSGGILFAMDSGKVKAFLAQYAGMPELAMRGLGLIALLFGLLMVSIVW